MTMTGAFPLPTFDTALQELTRDPQYAKVPADKRSMVAHRAWDKGCRAAHDLWVSSHGECDFGTLLRDAGIQVIANDADCTIGEQRYFSDYISGQAIVNLYLRSLQLLAQEYDITPQQAENMAMAHEYFHMLECICIGLTSREYQVPLFRIGRWSIGRTGIRAMSEVGAHAFVHTYFTLTELPEIPGQPGPQQSEY